MSTIRITEKDKKHQVMYIECLDSKIELTLFNQIFPGVREIYLTAEQAKYIGEIFIEWAKNSE